MQRNRLNTYLIGYSGHAYVVLESAYKLGLSILGYLEMSEKKKNPYNLSYAGSEHDFDEWTNDNLFILGIGENSVRRSLGLLVRKMGAECHSIIDPDSVISKSSHIASGSFIAPGAIINAQSNIGEDVIINSSAVVEHECVIGAGSHIAPNATLLGNVKVGENSFVGANAVIRQGVRLGDNVVVGAGSVVLSDVGSNLSIVGNPANRIING